APLANQVHEPNLPIVPGVPTKSPDFVGWSRHQFPPRSRYARSIPWRRPSWLTWRSARPNQSRSRRRASTPPRIALTRLAGSRVGKVGSGQHPRTDRQGDRPEHPVAAGDDDLGGGAAEVDQGPVPVRGVAARRATEAQLRLAARRDDAHRDAQDLAGLADERPTIAGLAHRLGGGGDELVVAVG